MKKKKKARKKKMEWHSGVGMHTKRQNQLSQK